MRDISVLNVKVIFGTLFGFRITVFTYQKMSIISNTQIIHCNIISLMKNKVSLLFLLLLGCAPISDRNDFFTEQIPSTGILETKPQNYPAGYAVDFETDSIVSLDEYPDFEYNMKMLAWRIMDEKTGSYGGRPVIFLWGDETKDRKAKALNVSEYAGIGLGAEGFVEFKEVTLAMQSALQADGVFPMDPNNEELYPWKDGYIILDEAELVEAYQVLVIGDKGVRLPESGSPFWRLYAAEGIFLSLEIYGG